MYPIPSLADGRGRSRQSSPIRFIDGRAARYNSSLLTKSQWSAARQGIQSPGYHVHCLASRYFVFTLTPTPESREDIGLKAQVKIGPMDSRYEYPECNCEQYMINHEACRHIFWLFDSILDYQNERTDDPDGSFALRKDGHALNSRTTPFNQIKIRGLENIADRRGWAFTGEGSSRRNRSGLGEDRWPIQAQTTDALLHMDQASEYSASLYSGEYLSRSPSLSGAVYRLAVSIPEFLADLRKEASVEACTRSYLKRLDRRIEKSFQRWINYTKTGAPRLGFHDDEASDPNDGFGAPNSVWICNRLRRFTQELGHELYQRGDLPLESRERAFGLLMKIFNNVVQFYDIDLKQHHYRPRGIVTYNETENERNIYTRLIMQPSPEEDHFVISVMRMIPEAGGPYLNELLSFVPLIQDTAHASYHQELKALIFDIEASAR